MAASPLAEIDWDNLTSGGYSLVTALNLLERMFAERTTLPTLVNTYSINSTFIDRFPFLSNSPDYGLPTWPATWGPRIFSLGNILRGYLSETKLINLFAGGAYTQFGATMDEATLFSDFGITEYPRMDVVNAVDVKKWYDILSSLKWLHSSFDRGAIEDTSFYDSTYREGLVDESNSGGGTFGNYKLVYGSFPAGSPPVAQFITDFNQAWTGPKPKGLADSPSAYYEFDYTGAGVVTNPPTQKQALIFKGYQRFDLSTFEATGHGGLSQDYRSVGAMNIVSQDFNGRTDFADYLSAFQYQHQVFAEFHKPIIVNIGGGVYEYGIPFSEPTTLPIDVGIFRATFANAGGCSTFDLWDQEGGFIYYTP